jgi:hypothetical protein
MIQSVRGPGLMTDLLRPDDDHLSIASGPLDGGAHELIRIRTVWLFGARR